MERVYQKTRMNTNSYARRERTREKEKPLFSTKKLALQTIASVIVFSFVYSMQFVDTPFSDAVINEASYTINYTVDLQSVYKSSREVFDYLRGSIEQGKSYIDNAVMQVQNPNVQGVEDNNATEKPPFSVKEQSGEQQ